MPNTKRAPDDLTMRMETEDDVEGHKISVKVPDDLVKATDDDVEGHAMLKSAPDSLARKATDDDVEGHRQVKAPDDLVKATDDDVEGHKAHRSAPDDLVKATDDDVEGHMIGAMNPIMARELARAKERDIQRSTSRGNLISEAKRAVPRKD